MDLHLKHSRPHLLKEEDRQYFQHFCSSPRHSNDSELDRQGNHDRNLGLEEVTDVQGRVEPWWRRVPEEELPANPRSPVPRISLTPSTSLHGGPPQSPGGRRMRLEAGQMQEAVLKDLMEAKRASNGKADTPADLLLSMLSDMLLGVQPDLGDVVLAKSVLLRHMDPYQPLNLHRQMREANLDADVVHALMHQLGSSAAASDPTGTPQSSRLGIASKPVGSGAGGGDDDAGHDEDRNAAVGAAFCAAAGGPADAVEGVEEQSAESLRDGLAALLGMRAAAAAAAGGLLPSSRRQRLAEGSPGSENGVGSSSGSGSGSGSDSDCGASQQRMVSPLCSAAAAAVSVPPPLLEEVERVLAAADAWQYDTWRLAEVTQGHALSCLAFYLLHREGLISQFRIRPTKLARLLRTLESGYPTNPYHNATHAADVLQTLHVLLRGSGMTGHYLDRLGLMAAYFAAIIHDHGHPGLTADFLIATSDPLAVRYNDRSPLENHHGASFFALLQQPGMDALEQLTAAERAAFRKQVLDLVMATDMKQHFSLLAHFNTAHHLAPYNKDAGPWALARSGGGRSRQSRAGPEPLGAGNLAGGQPEGEEAVGGVVGPIEDPRPADETERVLSLQIAFKAADLGHLGEELGVHKRWVRSLEEEFFRQGDLEQQLGLTISPLFDRTKQGVSKSQVGFYDFIALPLVHSLASAFPGAKALLACFVTNYDHWRVVEKAAAAAATAAVTQLTTTALTTTAPGAMQPAAEEQS